LTGVFEDRQISAELETRTDELIVSQLQLVVDQPDFSFFHTGNHLVGRGDYDFEEIWARAFDPQTKEYVKFLVTEPENLTREALYAKERALIADIKEELHRGRRCQVYAIYTGEKDVTLHLETVLRQEGIRVAILRSSVPTDKREDWYERKLKAGVEVVICHPKLVETGLDLLAFPTLYFYKTGYSLHTLRQASRRYNNSFLRVRNILEIRRRG
jgi:hypothetical protein